MEIFLKLDGIDGESTVKGHEKEIAVLSYEQAIDVAIVHSGGGSGAGAGKASFPGVRLRKNVDVASIPMLVACASGQHIREARFSFLRNTGAGAFYHVTLNDVLVAHVAQRAGTGTQYPLSFDALKSGDASDGLLDEITMVFSQIRWEYRLQRPDGSSGPPVNGGWDVRANRPL